MKTGGCCLPSHFGGPAQNTSREGWFGFRWACVRSCRRERRGELRQFVPSGMQKKKERTRRSSFFGGPAQNRTAVLQGSSADPTRLVGDRSRARKAHRRPFRTHASEDRSAAGEVSRRKEFPTGLTPRFRPWADERRRSLKSQAASATRRVARAATDLLLFLSAFKKFPFLRSRASGVHPANSACNRIQYRPAS